jgi:hypothetical protein
MFPLYNVTTGHALRMNLHLIYPDCAEYSVLLGWGCRNHEVRLWSQTLNLPECDMNCELLHHIHSAHKASQTFPISVRSAIFKYNEVVIILHFTIKPTEIMQLPTLLLPSKIEVVF